MRRTWTYWASQFSFGDILGDTLGNLLGDGLCVVLGDAVGPARQPFYRTLLAFKGPICDMSSNPLGNQLGVQ